VSLIRVSRPGHATEFIDLGPCVGRVTHTRSGVRGWALAPTIAGSFVTADPVQVRRDRNAEAAVRYRARASDGGPRRGRAISIHPENAR
jgi:hypothetical protein